MPSHKTEQGLRLKAAKYIEEKQSESSYLNHNAERRVPRFDPDEIERGDFLGSGGFCVVYEVYGINLKDSPVDDLGDHVFYKSSDSKIVQDRSFIASHVLRDECARYAIKKLSPNLSNRSSGTFFSGVIDLAMELEYLSVIQHPHIIKMRAASSCHPCSDKFFIVLDRLYETLSERIPLWKKGDQRSSGFSGIVRRISGKNGFDKKENIFAERIAVAHDICSALAYLHSNKIMYRDIKPDNIGFDIRGDVKIFDFGLAKELHEKNHVRGTATYKLTKRCGSPRYMAPEVFKGFPYNHKADVYSFGLLLWQLCSLDTPYDKFSYDMLSEQVMYGNQRPAIRSEWPPLVKTLITSSWDHDFMERPECEEICKALKSEIVKFAGDDVLNELDITNRTEVSVLGHK
mmetsp:Transcript_1302/g.2374  ORF Transcript_1302/g.2374 Transcript_1302/m.2374 type:complete len:402 (+) Transcript_1302:115-1320(+)